MSVVSPRNLADALRALADGNPRLLAGGTDLMVEFQTGRTQPGAIVDLWAIDELRAITADDRGITLGALTSCAALHADDRVPDVLRAAAFEVGAEQIRHRATIGGNLGTASPAADLTPVLFALDATVRLHSVRGEREVPVADFVTGYRETARDADELIHSVVVPRRPDDEQRRFRKIGTRRAQSISKVVACVALDFDGSRVARAGSGAGSVAPSTIELGALRELEGHDLDPQRIERAAWRAATENARPVDDVRSTAAYRREVLFRVLRGMLTSCAAANAGRGTSA